MSYLMRYSQTWWTWVSASSWQIAMLVTLIAVVVLAGRRLPARFRYVLWSLILIKALIPPTLSSPFSVGTWGVRPAAEWFTSRVPRVEKAEVPSSPHAASAALKDGARPHSPPADSASLAVQTTAITPALPAPTDTAVAASQPVPTPTPRHFPVPSIDLPWTATLLMSWVAGSMLFLCFVGVRYLRLLSAVHRAEEIDEGPLRVRLEQQALRLGRNTAPDLLLSSDVTSPFLMGFLRPRIILPADLSQTLTPQEMDNVLLHELVHWKRRDVLTGWLQVLVQALFWFHPFVWFANARLRHERESACDAAVLEVGESSPKGYGEALLKVLLAARGRSSAVMGFLGIFERDTRLQNRLEAIMNPQYRNRRIGVLGWSFLAAFALVFLPMASADSGQGKDESPPLHWVRVVLAPGGAMTFEGKETKLDELPSLLEKVPERADTVVQLSVTTDDMKLSEVRPVKYKLGDLVRQLGFKYLSEIENHPLGTWAISDRPGKNDLLKTISIDAERSPDNDRLSVQYAVIAVCDAAGIPYDWNKSTELADPQRRQVTAAIHFTDVTAETALLAIVKPAGLRFDIGENGLYLYSPEEPPAATQTTTNEQESYMVLLAELLDRAAAQALVESVTRDGYKPVNLVRQPGGYGVTVGTHTGKDRATKLADALERDGYTKVKVVAGSSVPSGAVPPLKGSEASGSSGHLELLIASGQSESMANVIARQLREAGYAPVRVDGENGKYSVFVGAVANKKEAMQLKLDLRKNGFTCEDIVPAGRSAPKPAREAMTIKTSPQGEVTYSFGADGKVASIKAQKEVELRQGNQTLTSDEVEIDPQTGTVIAKGNPAALKSGSQDRVSVATGKDIRVEVKNGNPVVRVSGPGARISTGEVSSPADDREAFLSKLNDDQRYYVNWTSSQFRKFIDRRSFPDLSDDERHKLEVKLIDTLRGPQNTDYYLAINTLAALRCKAAVPALLEIATDRKEEDCRDRWMATRALGIIGDKSVVPELIHLVYYPNQNTRLWAQISLVRLTGENFGTDWEAWGRWWNSRNGQPPFKPEKIAWTKNAEWLDQAKQAESDRKWFDGQKNPRESAAGTPAPATASASVPAYRSKGPDWCAKQATGEPDTENAGDVPSAWASLKPDDGEQWLELDYDPPFVATMVRIHETFNPGAVTAVILKGTDGTELLKLPVTDSTRMAPAFLEVPFTATSAPVKTVRVVIDSSKVPGWNEIDAVQLAGGSHRAWAADARASSSYADRGAAQRVMRTVTQVQNNFALENEIPVSLEWGTTEHPRILRASQIRFKLADKELQGLLELGYSSWPKTEWNLSVYLLDDEGKILGQGSERIENQGVIAGVAVWSTTTLTMKLGTPAEEILNRVKKFRIEVSGQILTVQQPQQAAATPVPQEPIPDNTTILSYVGDKEQGKRSIAAGGHAVQFKRPFKAHWVEAVQIFAGRYGTPQPPPEDFHLYLMNKDKQVLADLKYPYAMIERSDMKWYTLRTPSVEVPEDFFVALAFNPHQTKGIYLGFDKASGDSHSLVGLPDSGYEPVKDGEEWMVRVHLAEAPSGKMGTMRLADWKPPVKEEPFKDCVEAKYDNGNSEGMQSYGGSGPAIKIKPSEFLPKDIVEKYASSGPFELKGIRIYGSRYGSGYDPDQTMIHLTLLDSENKELAKTDIPYSKFSYKAQWVDLPLAKPVKIEKPDQELTIALNPEAHQTKGIYFHYNKNPQTSHSYAGTVEKGFKPVTDREWMIRSYFAVAGSGSGSERQSVMAARGSKLDVIVESRPEGKNHRQYAEVGGQWIDSVGKSQASGLSDASTCGSRKSLLLPDAQHSTVPASARFAPALETRAHCYVYVTWPRQANARLATYVIKHANGEDTKVWDQDGWGATTGPTGNGGMWNLLGDYDFDAGQNQYVEVRKGALGQTVPMDPGNPGQLFADAVRFTSEPLDPTQSSVPIVTVVGSDLGRIKP